MTTENKVSIVLSDATVAKATALMRESDLGLHSVIDRAVTTQVWVEEKQAAGKTVLAATGTDSDDGKVWSDYEYLSAEPTFEEAPAE